MTHTLACPNCSHEIEVTALMRTQLAAQIRGELDAEATSARQEVERHRREIAQQQAELKKERESLVEQVKQQVESQRGVLLDEAKRQAAAKLAIEIADRDAQVKELEDALSTARDQELELRKQQRQLNAEKESMKLTVARQLDEERQRLIQETRLQFDQENDLKQAEKDKKIADLAAKLKEMQRRMEQGSQQLQGEVQELALEQLLQTAFASDEVNPVGKGVSGGDCMQTTINRAGQVCGQILWESKRTKRWGSDWLAKARDDARESRSDCVVIVSEALPDGVQGFAFIESVWVCSWPAAKSLALALRHGLIEIAKARTAAQGQHAKQELVYNYLAGSEFQRRVAGIAEAFITMQTDLDSEKRAFKKQWSKREKQIERAITNTASLYGDLQGIIGSSLPMIDGLEIPLLVNYSPSKAEADCISQGDL
jgi:hypothetical protein